MEMCSFHILTQTPAACWEMYLKDAGVNLIQCYVERRERDKGINERKKESTG
jgi:hypothetical protein